MSEIRVRRSHMGDINGIYAVETASFASPWSRAAFEAELTDNDLAFYLVAEAAGAIIAYAGMWVIVDEAHITNVAVAPAWRGKGVGEIIMKALMERARERGAVKMTLEVRPSNEAAKRLYAKLGFVQRGRRHQYYTDNREDALVMWLDPL